MTPARLRIKIDLAKNVSVHASGELINQREHLMVSFFNVCYWCAFGSLGNTGSGLLFHDLSTWDNEF